MTTGKFAGFPPNHLDHYATVILTDDGGKTHRATFRNEDIKTSPSGEVSILPTAVPVEVWAVRYKDVPTVAIPDEVVGRVTEQSPRDTMFYPG